MNYDLEALIAEAHRERNRQINLLFSDIFAAVGRRAGVLGRRLSAHRRRRELSA